MKCPECGQEVVGTDKFCPNCGASLPREETIEPAADQELVADEIEGEPEAVGGELENLAEESEGALEEAEAAFEGAELPPLEEETPFIAAEPATPAGPPPVVKAKGKTNTGLIIGIVVLVLLLLCCCCAIGIIAANFDEITSTLETWIELTPMP